MTKLGTRTPTGSRSASVSKKMVSPLLRFDKSFAMLVVLGFGLYGMSNWNKSGIYFYRLEPEPNPHQNVIAIRCNR